MSADTYNMLLCFLQGALLAAGIIAIVKLIENWNTHD